MAVLAAIVAIVAPTVVGRVESARLRAAEADARTLSEALLATQEDLGDFAIFRSGAGRTLDDASTYDILHGPGRVPGVAASVSGGKWDPLADGVLDDAEAGDDADALADQLVANEPGYPTDGRFSWRGPYVETPAADPWGNAYLVNAENLRPAQAEAAYVLSAGQNGLVETPFEMSRGGAVNPGGDDVIVRVR